MNNKSLQLAVMLLGLAATPFAHAATEWSAEEYNLYAGDFNGDGKDDLLYVAKDPAKPSGIAVSDGSAPNIAWQTWASNYLNIPWSGNQYTILVADFNNDGKDDLLMQKATAGDHYLLLTDSGGKVSAINQTIANAAFGSNLALSVDQHKLLARDFNNDGKADLFLQAVSASGLHAVVYADSSGLFTGGPTQTWSDGYLGLNWSSQKANVYAGDFNGDHYADLLVQAKPKFVTIDYDVPFPVPTYPANMNGVVYSQGNTSPFQLVGAQTWSRNNNGVDWSSLTNTLVIGDFNGDGRDDVLFQPKYSTGTNNLLTGNVSGAAFPSTATAVSSNVPLASSNSTLVVGNFDGGTAVGLYVQALTASGTNYVANSVGATTTATTHNPSAATGVVPATAVGHTVGSFAVTNSGAATYSIPITVPPGVAGIQPSLSIAYQSGGGNGHLGIGWGISGLSVIDHCKKTLAQDGSSSAVTLTTADAFCLDGNKLRLTSGTYGATNSAYQTEMETFSRVTAASTTVGNGPAYFTVEGKDGLKYEYGGSVDSRIESTASGVTSTPRVWALNKVSDRVGNSMTISYIEDGAPNGSFRPDEIIYTANSSAGLSAAYKVRFIWEARPASDVLTSYFAGGYIKESNRLNRIETQYNSGSGFQLVRKYQMSYNTSGVTPRSRLGAVQECDGGGYCLAPTIIGWQDGTAGWSVSDTTSNSDASAEMESSVAIDIDGDGRQDLVYPQGGTWWFMRAISGGVFDSPVNSGVDASNTTALPIDYFAEGRQGLLVSPAGYSTRQILRWNGSNLAVTDTNITVALTGKEYVADLDADGLTDFMYLVSNSSSGLIYVLKNSGATSGSAQFGSAQLFYSTTPTGVWTMYPTGVQNNTRVLDFNSDGRADYLYAEWYVECELSICVRTTTWVALQSTGSGFTVVQSWDCELVGSVPCSASPLVGDFNGDGLTDVVTVSPTAYQIAYGSGSGLTAPASLTLPSGVNLNGFATDYDGDGRSDIAYAPSPTSGSWYLARSNGTGFDAPVALPVASSSSNNTIRVFDMDGDGQSDIGYKGTQYRVRKHNGVISDLVRSITDGFGNNVSLIYAPLTDSAVYAKGSGAAFPEMDIQAPMYVVKQYSTNDGIGGGYNVTENYGGARVHLQGRGFLGFAARTETDSRTGIQSAMTFNQVFPKIGSVAMATVKQPQPNGKTISSTTTTYTDLVTNSAQYADRHYVYASSTTQTSYEVSAANSLLDGAVVKSVTTALTNVDAYGNPGTVTATTNDLTGSGQTFIATTSNTYTNDTTNWCLGFVTQQQVTTAVPNVAPLAGNATPTRTIAFEKDSDAPKCRVYRQTLEPNTSTQVVTTFEFDSMGHTKKTTLSAAGIADRVAEVSYGTQGVYPVQFTNAVGEVSYKTYDYALGVPLTATDPNGIQASWQYDGFGRKTRANAPDGTATTWALSACNVVNGYCGDGLLRYKVTQQQLDGSVSHNVVRTDVQLFDAFNRALYSQAQTFSGAYSMVRSIYNSKGQLERRSVPYYLGFTPTYSTNTYDLLGRVLKIERQASESDTSLQTVEYTYAKLVESVKDSLNHTTTKTTNAIGKVVQVADANGSITQYQYDALGNLAKTTDSAGNQISSTFNLRGFKVTSSDPDMGNWSYDYYPSGELKTQTDAKNQVVTFTYDNISRPRTRTEPEGVTTWNYGASAAAHNIGQLDYVCMGTGANCAGQTYREAYTYDALGRAQNITYTQDTTYQVDYSYNNQGALDTLTYPTSTAGYRLKLQYAYTNGQLAQVRDYNAGTQFWTLNATNAANQAVDELMANGVRIISDFDGISGAISYRQSGNGGSTSNLQNLSYQWDKAGNLKQRQDVTQNLTEVFNYDALNRVDNSTLNGSQNLDVAVNAIGNLTNKSDISASTYDYTTAQAGCTYYAHAQPHAVRSIGSNVYCYDANGNMTSRQGSTITWTSYNLPNQINSGSNYSQFSYGPARQRWRQVANYSGTTETTIYVGGLIEKVTRGSLTEYKHYIAGGSATAIYTRRSDSTTGTYYVTSDHLGSADVITDGTGAAVVRESFAAYGARRGGNWTGSPSAEDQAQFTATTRRGYTGHEMLDNLSLIHMNGRVYDPQIGRFISADPYIQSPLNQQNFNRYSYVDNGPMSATDPSGYFKLKDLLNPFSKDNPLSPVGSIGKYVTADVLTRPLFESTLPFLLYSNYQANKATDRFFMQNPELQPIASFIAGVVGAIYGQAWVGPAVNAHFTRLNGGSTEDILRTFAISYAISYVGSEVNMHYGNTYNLERVVMEGLVGGVASELNGGAFWDGFAMSGGIALMSWGAFEMRETMKNQSLRNDLNSSGTSDGMFGDQFKLGGGRAGEGDTSLRDFGESPLGGKQGGPGKVFGRSYSPGGFVDHVIESYAGPHDWLSSFRYTSDGMLKTWGTWGTRFYGFYSGLAVIPATPFAIAPYVPAGNIYRPKPDTHEK